MVCVYLYPLQMKHPRYHITFLTKVSFILFFFAGMNFVLKANDTSSVNGHVLNVISNDSTGLLTVLKQNKESVFMPLYYAQNIGGLSFNVSPKFSLTNWYEHIFFHQVNTSNIVLTDSALTNVNYSYGLDASHEFLGTFSSKINKTYLNLAIERTASASRFSSTDVKNISFLASFRKDEGRYRFNYGFERNSFYVEDNGGFEDSLEYINAEELNSIFIGGLLDQAHHEAEMTKFSAGNQLLLNWKQKSDTASSDSIIPKYWHTIGYELQFQKEEYAYAMSKQGIDSVFFDNTLRNSEQTWDSVGFSMWRYAAYYQLLDSNDRNIFSISYHDQLFDWKALNQTYVETKFSNHRFGELNLFARYNLKGRWKGGYHATASFDRKIRVHWLTSAKYELDHNLPGYFYLRYQGNHFNWSNTFKKVTNQAMKWSVMHLPFKIGLETNIRLLDNWVYLDTLSHPIQLDEQIQYYKVGLFNMYHNKFMSIYTKLAYQRSNNEVIRFPSYHFRNVLTYHFRIGRVKFATGYIFSYFSRYTGLGYNPNLRRTFLQYRNQVGGIPLLDLFATVSVGEANVFVKGENLVFETFSRAFYLYPGRPVVPRYLRIGFSWNLKN